ncbi:chain length determinant protein EpsF [Duganella sp. HSC-15S17]|uniref:Chain length determinant protein EpsF n=1 Tax=Duganella violaceipulchra TaxID=2849652 RepID=A0ABT1GMV9_9BURK|nr:chain length determinant protein EpsF [Duganella violaceicalia]
MWTLLVTLVLTIVVSLVMPKTYKGIASVLLNSKGVDPVTGMASPGLLMPGYVATQIDVLGSKNVALRVVDRLHLATNPVIIQQFQDDADGKGTVRDWLAELLLKKLDITPSRESSVVEISFKGADPDFVAAIANAFVEEYQKLSIQLKVDPSKKAALYFNDQIKVSRDAVEAAQSRLTKYQQEHGIVSIDNRLDVESNRLNDLSAQLVMAQGQSMEAASRKRAAGSSDSPDVANNPLIQNLRASLSNAESKLAELGQRLGKNHPQYQSSKAEVDQLHANLVTQMQAASNSVGNNASILSQREGAIRAALAEQKSKVLELNRTRDELNVLQKDVEGAQRAYDTTSMRLSQTRLEGQAEQSEVAILNPAVPPVDAWMPRLPLNIALALVIGTMLGLGFAMLAEMLDRRVRSAADLVDLAQLPVLGSIQWGAPQRPRSKLAKAFAPRRARLN